MAPKIAYGQLPRAAAEFKKLLESQGGGVNADAIAKLDSKDRNKVSCAMMKNMSVEAQLKYKALTVDNDRHAFIAEYILDPKDKTCKAINSISRIGESGTKNEIVWVTLDELGGPKYMNSTANAKVAITTMESKPHENKSLADAGVLVYKQEIVKAVMKKITQERAELQATADGVDQESFDRVYDHMKNSANPGEEATRPAKKQKKEKAEVQAIEDGMTPEKAAWKVLNPKP